MEKRGVMPPVGRTPCPCGTGCGLDTNGERLGSPEVGAMKARVLRRRGFQYKEAQER